MKRIIQLHLSGLEHQMAFEGTKYIQDVNLHTLWIHWNIMGKCLGLKKIEKRLYLSLIDRNKSDFFK
jgi:hypothetical protein